MQSSGKTKLVDLNQLLTCVLCKGYYIDATTIIECLHSFCRTCIVRYLQFNKFCPTCEVQVHKTRPLLNIRSDQTLQDIVYKLVPGLFKNEMKRRRDFYRQKDALVIPSSSEKRGDVWGCDRLIFTPEDIISVSLEYSPLPEQLPIKLHTNVHLMEKNKFLQSHTRYLRCPGALKVYHLKKLLRAKYGLLSSKKKLDILYRHDLLKDQYTLVDLAYIYAWKRSEPLRLFYKITQESNRRITRERSSVTKKTDVAAVVNLPAPPLTTTSSACTTISIASPSSSMAAAPSSRHPSPPPSPQMAQEPNDFRVGKPNSAIQSEHNAKIHIAAVPGPKLKGALKRPASHSMALSPFVKIATIPETKLKSALKRHASISPVVPNAAVPEPKLKSSLKRPTSNSIVVCPVVQNAAGLEPKLKSALKRPASNSMVVCPVVVSPKREFVNGSHLSKGALSKAHLPSGNGVKTKKRVSFSVNLVQDCCHNTGLQENAPTYPGHGTLFRVDPVNDSAINKMIHLKSKVLSHKSS